ncbi:glycosyltransferase [Hymenobacter sp. BT175]|uniref:glycosyltransferase n=1 Tax=Hymenobacter translucens TaxID=2886507 RepID=UPI001D0EC0EA|nr:glycosyltransferase [Hymenobacter translucens]MCC2547236.1 glycosyltransferase [Hymenobacter translucens]
MKARVLMLPKWYPNRYDDQDGDFVARHVAAIAPYAEAAVLFATVARGPLPHLIVAEPDLLGPMPVLRYYYRARITGVTAIDKVLKLGLYFWCLLRGYRALCRRWGARPALVHVHVLLRTGLFAAALQVLTGIPYLITEHWTLYLPGKAESIGWLRRQLTRVVVRRAAALHTVSDNLRRAMQHLGMANELTLTIPNVVDLTLFELAATQAEALPPTGGKLLHVAAFNEPAKNLTGILRTVARLRQHRPNLTLRIAGYGPDEGRVRQVAAELSLLDGAVQFLGKLTQPQVAAEMQQADCLVLFSNFENLPCVLIEAQASGLPAVATQVGGVPELLPPDGRYGRLVPPGDEAALEQALEDVLKAKLTFQPEMMRTHATEHFGYAAVGRQFAALYAKLLAKTSFPDSPTRPA